MKIRTMLCALVLALAATVGALASTAAAAPPSSTMTATVVGTDQVNGVLNGVLTFTNVTLNAAGQLVATGTFEGTRIVDGVATQVTDTFTTVLQVPTRPCTILDLDVGPIHLDLLGLVIDVSEIHVTITGQPGPGKLLGNLLCSVAGLLDTGAPLGVLQRLLDLLNEILAV